ncbi:hypothetical protein PCO31110_01974 [Pandoraea communis]|uniref:Lipoprotein n=1 Tax=Pandoraea communis TaxID=2508297 RepID=A0A5E4UC93_9BURK|nr:hypothetical protein [Pandoraea communis]VVD97687.1 hypothetical protein PCO31110_01974 [Pandoraea communis]
MRPKQEWTFGASLVAIGLLLASSVASADTESVYIGMTPTEFSEGFNRAAQVLRLKPRMPRWPARSGNLSASIAPGITVTGVGVDDGNMMSSIAVSCRSDAMCNEAIVAAALSADPELSVEELRTFIQRRLDGELAEGVYFADAGLAYTVQPNKKKAQLDFRIKAAPDSESE